jgi:hypothetical protein
MPFTYTRTGRSVFGNKRIEYGTYASTSGSTGGTIKADIGRVEFVTLTSTTTSNTVRGTVTSTSAGSVVIATGANDVGMYQIQGTK